MNKPVLITVFSLFLSSTAYAAAPPKDVNVVNTPNVNVTSMPPVQVDVPNGLDVNITNTHGVTIENGPLSPVPISPPVYPREVVRLANYIQVSSGNTSVTDTIYTVPEGKRLVIEQIFARYISGITTEFDYSTLRVHQGTSGLVRSYLDLSMSRDEPDGVSFKRYITNQQVRLYAEPNDTVTLQLVRRGIAGYEILNYSISGYLIPADSPSLAP